MEYKENNINHETSISLLDMLITLAEVEEMGKIAKRKGTKDKKVGSLL